MIFYLSHNFAAREALRDSVIPIIEANGHTVQSRWITEDHDGGNHSNEDRKRFATEDFLDITASDYVLHWCDQFGPKSGRGKHIEVGYALATGKRIIIIGKECEESVFYFLPNVRRFRNIQEWGNYMVALPKESQ